MAEQLPINPAILFWARQRAGLTREQAAKKFARIAEWESGELAPTYPQLEQLADALKVPIAVFFFPDPPDVPSIEETFRTLPDAEIGQLPSRIRMLLRKAKAFQLNLHELTHDRNPAERLITRDLTFPTNINVEEMAAAVRAYIGVPVEEQQSWRDDDTAQKEWRAALLRVGIFIFKDAFKLEEYSGFCLYDELFPIIYVNNSATKTRQMFTYFHELAHLLFHTSGIDSEHDRYIPHLKLDAQRIETLCNRFAAHFLLPDAEMQRAMQGREATGATATLLAAQFHVSRAVIFRRYLDQKLINQSQYDESISHWDGQKSDSGANNSGNHYWSKLSYLGRDYVALALGQFHQNRIDQNQLADYLDTKPRNVGTLEDYFSRGNA